MKGLIIFCSNYNDNTKKIAQLFAEKADCELKNIVDAGDVIIENYDLIGFGSGVYQENLSPKLFGLVNKLNLKGQNVFVFSTSGVGAKLYNKRLIKLLESKGAISRGSFACKGSFVAREFTDKKIFSIMGILSQGHPNDKDFRKAENFIAKVIDSLKTVSFI